MSCFYNSPEWLSFGLGHPGGEASTKWLLSHAAKGGKLLDFCCGAGDSAALALSIGFSVTGTDTESSLKHAAEKHPGLTLIPWNGEELGFEPGSFDAVLCECSLSLLDDPDEISAQFFRLLSPGGLLLLSDIYDGIEIPSFSHFSAIAFKDLSEDLKQFAAKWLWETERPFPAHCASGYFAAVYRRLEGS